MTEKLLTVKEVSSRIGFCDEHVRRLMRSGAIKSEIVGKSWRTRESDLEEFIRNPVRVEELRRRLIRWLALVPDDPRSELRQLAAETFPGLPAGDRDEILGLWGAR